MKKTIAILVAALVVGVAVGAATRPARSGTGARHPNLTAAQQLTKQSVDKINAAIRVNELDSAGHTTQALQYLAQANAELKLAIEQMEASSGAK